MKDLIRFFSWVNQDGPNGCWLWDGYIDKSQDGGYGIFSIKSKLIKAHRFAYQQFKGSIPIDREIDHLCRVRNCCNPEHLEVVTRKTNVRRGLVPKIAGKFQRNLTHCKHGHKYDDSTTVLHNGWRSCLICRREAAKRYRNSKKGGN